MSTLKDVAARCGLDISTVSRALRSDPRVKEKTRIKVNQAAIELHYTPNLAARNLVKGRSHTLALITSSLTNPMEQIPAQYASLFLQDKSYDLMISLSGRSDKTFERLLSRLEQNIFDGAIIIPGSPLTKQSELIFKRLKKRDYPIVFLDRWDERISFPVVTTDNKSAGARLADNLIDGGCQRIVILRNQDNGVEEERENGEKHACLKRGITPEIVWTNEDHFSYQQKNCPTGIISTSFETIHDFTKNYERQTKYKLMFGVFDEWSGTPYPACEVIICKQNFPAMAEKACQIILDKLEGKTLKNSPYLVPPHDFKKIHR